MPHTGYQADIPATERDDYRWEPTYRGEREPAPARGSSNELLLQRLALSREPTSYEIPDARWEVEEGSPLANACAASAISAAIQLRLKQDGIEQAFRPSVPFIYYIGRYLLGAEGGNRGMSIYNGLRACFYYGFCHHDRWPLEELKTEAGLVDLPPQGAVDDAGGRGVLRFEHIGRRVWDDRFLRVVKQAIVEDNAVIFGVRVNSNFIEGVFRNEAHDLLDDAPPKDDQQYEDQDRHCLLAIGFNDDGGYLSVRDSISPTRGVGGYLRIPYEYIRRSDLSSDFWVVSQAAVSNPESPGRIRWAELRERRVARYADAQKFARETAEAYQKVRAALNAVATTSIQVDDPTEGAPPNLPVRPQAPA